MAGRKKGHAKTGGRQKGTPNKATVEIREAARAFVEDEAGRQKLLEQYQAGTLHPSLLQMFFHYAYGKPKEQVELTGPDSGAIVVRWGGDASDRPT